MKAQPVRHKRKRLYVFPELQGRLLNRLVLYWVIYHLALWHVMFAFHLVGAIGTGALEDQGLRVWELYSQFVRGHIWIILSIMAMGPMLVWDMLKFSHRMFGPLYRCRSIMQALADGKPQDEMRLRKHDLLGNFIDVFNNLIRSCNVLLKAAQEKPEDPKLVSADSSK